MSRARSSLSPRHASHANHHACPCAIPARRAGIARPSFPPRPPNWLNTEKGFGYLEPDDRTSPVFVDFRAIDSPGYKTLGPGRTVVFTTTITDRGPEAATVRLYPRPCTSRR